MHSNSFQQPTSFNDLSLFDAFFNIDQNMPPVSPYEEVISRCAAVIFFGKFDLQKIKSMQYYEELFKMVNIIEKVEHLHIAVPNVLVINICFRNKSVADHCIRQFATSLPNIKIRSAADLLISAARKSFPHNNSITSVSAFHQIYRPTVPSSVPQHRPQFYPPNNRPNLRVIRPVIKNTNSVLPPPMIPRLPTVSLNNHQNGMVSSTPQTATPQSASYHDMFPSTSMQPQPLSAPPNFGSPQPNFPANLFPFPTSSVYGCTSNSFMNSLSNVNQSFPTNMINNNNQLFTPNTTNYYQ